MKKIILPLIVSLGLFATINFMFGTLVTNGKNQKLQEKLELSHKQIDSLNSVIEDKEFQIETLEEECQTKESEISFWGRMYDECKGIK